METNRRARNEKIIFTPEQDKYLEEHVGTMSLTELAHGVGLSAASTIKRRLVELGLWSYQSGYSGKKVRETSTPVYDIVRKKRSVGYSHGYKSKASRYTDESKKMFLYKLTQYRYVVRRASKVVFSTSRTDRHWRLEKRLRTDFPDWQFKDLAYLSNTK